MLPPTAHVALFRDKLGGLAMVCLQEVNGLLPFGEPEFVLGRSSSLNATMPWPGRSRHQGYESQLSLSKRVASKDMHKNRKRDDAGGFLVIRTKKAPRRTLKSFLEKV